MEKAKIAYHTREAQNEEYMKSVAAKDWIIEKKFKEIIEKAYE
jgi:hypothetical protein